MREELWEWPDELDALVAAPAQHFTSIADFVRRDAEGATVIDSRAMELPEPPFVFWSEPVDPHTLENVGDGLVHAIVVELQGS